MTVSISTTHLNVDTYKEFELSLVRAWEQKILHFPFSLSAKSIQVYQVKFI